MAIYFVRDEDGTVPQFNRELDGFGEILASDLSGKAVKASNVNTAFANVPKKGLTTMLGNAKVKFNKSASKEDLVAVVGRNWQTILDYMVGMMGAHRFHEEANVNTTATGCGAIFVKKGDVIYPTFHTTLKGFAIIEWKALESIVTIDMALPQVSKKSMEELMAHCGMRLRTSGAETWNTTDRVMKALKENWDRIMERGGYKHPAPTPPPPPPQVEEDEDAVAEFGLFNPYTGAMDFVMLDTSRSLAEICMELSEKYYRPDEPLPVPCINVLLPFGPMDEDGSFEVEVPRENLLSAHVASSSVPEPSPAFQAFSGRPMKLGEATGSKGVEKIYLNEKGTDTVGEVVVAFPVQLGFSGKLFIFYYNKDHQWKALYDAISGKTPLNLNENLGFFLRLVNGGSKTVSHETIRSWATPPAPLLIELGIDLKGGGVTRKAKDKVKMIASQKAEVLKLAEKMKNEERSTKSIGDIITENSAKMDLIWKMYETGKSKDVIELIMGDMSQEAFTEMFEFPSPKPEKKLEHVVSVMLKSYIPETMKAHSAMSSTISSSGSCLNLALKSCLVKDTGSIDWEALKRMAEIETKARLKKPSTDVNMG